MVAFAFACHRRPNHEITMIPPRNSANHGATAKPVCCWSISVAIP